ncbi:TECPR1, partial [Cordylochernes scorpioides]
MPPSTLWGVTRRGKVFQLGTRGCQWKPLRHQQGVKRLATVHDLAWAVGSDHHIYIYIPIRDIPIRCKEVTFENQRWNPMEGFSGRLLPTDRPQFSSEHGLENLPKSKFQLPSSSWQWETEWAIEDNLEGQPLDPEGWTYAFDFPANFGPSKHWNSMVRRRKWFRYRRFIAMDSWASIPGIHEDPVKEPFIDVAIGGTEISGGDPNHYSVWAVTILGQIVYRAGVTTWCPEGTEWVPVSVPAGAEVSQVDVGPHGQVWAVCWDGSALVRVGVSRHNIYVHMVQAMIIMVCRSRRLLLLPDLGTGTGWLAVAAPSPEAHLIQVAIGSNVVWATCKLGKVCSPKGVQGANISTIGVGWVEMVGQMAMLSVAPFDQ